MKVTVYFFNCLQGIQQSNLAIIVAFYPPFFFVRFLRCLCKSNNCAALSFLIRFSTLLAKWIWAKLLDLYASMPRPFLSTSASAGAERVCCTFMTHISRGLPFAFYTTFGKRRHVRGDKKQERGWGRQQEVWVLALPKVLFFIFFFSFFCWVKGTSHYQSDTKAHYALPICCCYCQLWHRSRAQNEVS